MSDAAHNIRSLYELLNSYWDRHIQTYSEHCLTFKVGLSPSKKICVICLIESPLKMMKNVLYFALNASFILKIFKFLSQHFGHVGKTAWLER